MTADVVNLRRIRKQKQRAERADEAVTNRAIYGRSKVQRHIDEQAVIRTARALDGHRLENAGSEDDYRP